MNPERWQRIKKAFSAALDVPTEQRVAWLSSALPDDSSLAREVKDLLTAHERATDFYDRGALAAVPELRQQLDVAVEGMRLGPYRVLSEIGRGGMGAVYLAVREEPGFTQKVAIKLIKRGMDTDEIVRRFVAERQILATLAVHIPKECTAATVTVGYDGPLMIMPWPGNWTLNIGDSPTNNGWAGDAGTTPHNAELWINNQILELANASNNPLNIDSPLVANDLRIDDGGMQFLIKDQFVSWGHPRQISQSATRQQLFAIPDTTLDKDQRSIYVGLNRVISGPGNRTGCGLRSAVIAFQ